MAGVGSVIAEMFFHFVFTTSSICINGSQALLKPSPASLRVASIPQLRSNGESDEAVKATVTGGEAIARAQKAPDQNQGTFCVVKHCHRLEPAHPSQHMASRKSLPIN